MHTAYDAGVIGRIDLARVRDSDRELKAQNQQFCRNSTSIAMSKNFDATEQNSLSLVRMRKEGVRGNTCLGTPVYDKDLDSIRLAASFATSSCEAQPWEFLVLKEAVLQCRERQNRAHFDRVIALSP